MSDGPICVFDGNSGLVRSHFAMAGTGMRTSDGKASWALRGLWTLMSAAVSRVGAAGALVAFDTGRCFRSDEYDEYKSGRPEKDSDLRFQIAAAPEHYRNAGLSVVTLDGYEADDLVASASRQFQRLGAATVVVTSDRDAFSLISADGPGIQVLRMVNGGARNWPLLTADRLRALCGVYPDEYLLYAALRGDSSDNLPGVQGIGPKTAVRIIDHLRATGITMRAALADFDDGGTVLASAIGAAGASKFANAASRANLTRNLHLMRQVDDLSVGQPADTLFPIDPARFSREMRAWEFRIDPGAFTHAPARPTDTPAQRTLF